LGFSFTEGGIFGFVTAIEEFIILIASVFVAARFGKIRILRLSLLILSAGLFLFTTSGTYLMAAVIILIIGLGQGFMEGMLTPLVEDLHPNDRGRKMNLVHAFWPIGVCSSVLIVGELLSRDVSWRTIFAGLGLLAFLASFFYPRAQNLDLPRSRGEISHIGEILRITQFWILGFCLFLAGGAEGSFTYWSATYIQVNFEALPRAGAIGTASFALGMIAGRIISSHLSQRLGLKRLLIVAAVFTLVFAGAFFFIDTLLSLYVSIGLIGLCIACMWPSIQSYAVMKIKADITTIMIFLSCFGLAGFSSATLVMGIIGDISDLRYSFLLAPCYLALLLILFGVDEIVQRNKHD
jgi:fucose permease